MRSLLTFTHNYTAPGQNYFKLLPELLYYYALRNIPLREDASRIGGSSKL